MLKTASRTFSCGGRTACADCGEAHPLKTACNDSHVTNSFLYTERDHHFKGVCAALKSIICAVKSFARFSPNPKCNLRSWKHKQNTGRVAKILLFPLRKKKQEVGAHAVRLVPTAILHGLCGESFSSRRNKRINAFNRLRNPRNCRFR